jgi:hypothetical protein
MSVSGSPPADGDPEVLHAVPAGWEVVNPPVVQMWAVVFGAIVAAGTALSIGRLFVHAPLSGAFWGDIFGAVVLPLSWCTAVAVRWAGMATFVFGPDRLLVRTWVDRYRRRPWRVYRYSPGFVIAYERPDKVVLRPGDGTERRTSADQMPPSATRRLGLAALAHGLQVEYRWERPCPWEAPPAPGA